MVLRELDQAGLGPIDEQARVANVGHGDKIGVNEDNGGGRAVPRLGHLGKIRVHFLEGLHQREAQALEVRARLLALVRSLHGGEHVPRAVLTPDFPAMSIVHGMYHH